LISSWLKWNYSIDNWSLRGNNPLISVQNLE
jgi:hypothetical protein